MSIFFITYGDNKFQVAKERITKEAKATNSFDYVIAYGRDDLSKELLNSSIINIPRGGGLWSWKPDVIWQTMQQADDGDLVFYCDSGCSLSPSKEWEWYKSILGKYEIVAQRILMRTDKWTRREIIEKFNYIQNNWKKCYQFEATSVILRVTPFTRAFINEWRTIMIYESSLVMDVADEERVNQLPEFIENRHDQAIYSALLYKYLDDLTITKKIYACWDRIEDCRMFGKQAIRATRLRNGEKETTIHRILSILKRIIKSFVFIPFYYSPLQKHNFYSAIES